MQQVIQTGAGIKVLVNGSIVGFATGISFTRSTNAKYIYEIDNPFAVEITNTTYSVSGSLAGFRVRGAGGLDSPAIMNVSSAKTFFDAQYVTIEVVDRSTDKVVYKINQALFDQDSWSIQIKQQITFNANFKGVFVKSEATLA